jgi:hypothetical protein
MKASNVLQYDVLQTVSNLSSCDLSEFDHLVIRIAYIRSASIDIPLLAVKFLNVGCEDMDGLNVLDGSSLKEGRWAFSVEIYTVDYPGYADNATSLFRLLKKEGEEMVESDESSYNTILQQTAKEYGAVELAKVRL